MSPKKYPPGKQPATPVSDRGEPSGTQRQLRSATQSQQQSPQPHAGNQLAIIPQVNVLQQALVPLQQAQGVSTPPLRITLEHFIQGLATLKALPRFEQLNVLVENMAQHMENQDMLASGLMEYMTNDPRGREARSAAPFDLKKKEHWITVEEAAIRANTTIKKKTAAIKRIQGYYPNSLFELITSPDSVISLVNPDTNERTTNQEFGQNFLQSFARMCAAAVKRNLSANEVMKYILGRVYTRMVTKSQGIQNTRALLTSDVDQVTKDIETNITPRPITDAQWRALGLSLHPRYQYPIPMNEWSVASKTTTPIGSPTQSPVFGTPTPIQASRHIRNTSSVASIGQGGFQIPSPIRTIVPTLGGTKIKIFNKDDPVPSIEHDVGRVLRNNRITAPNYNDNRSPTADEEEAVAEGTSPADVDYVEEKRNAIREIGRGNCKCADEITPSLHKSIASNVKLSQAAVLHLMREVVKAMDKSQSPEQALCYQHSQLLASKAGFRTKGLRLPELVERIRKFQDSRTNIGDYKQSKDTYSHFRKGFRNPVPSDTLGPYKYSHDPWASILNFEFTPAMQQAFQKRFFPANIEPWNKTGNILDGNIFNFLCVEDQQLGVYKGSNRRRKYNSLLDIFRLEADLYLFHQREINGNPNYGWLRNMWFSLAQQTMRQSIRYWLLYVAFRPDQGYRLISYVYYAKNAVKGDRTAFRHVDINLFQCLASSRGYNQLQGTLSLDDEDEDNCTEILYGLHTKDKLRQWLKRLENRNMLPRDGFVHKIENKHWTRDDQKALDSEGWVKVPCQAGMVRMTSPLLPHGSTGPATKQRRTLLPWFVLVNKDHQTLEIPESGTWSELAQAHRDMVPGPSTPSGHSVNYGKIPYRTPFAVPLHSAHPVAGALIGRSRWDDTDVVNEVRTILAGQDVNHVEAIVAEQERELRNLVAKKWKLVQHLEKSLFPTTKSFFYCREHGISTDQAPKPDEDSEVQEYMRFHNPSELFEQPINGGRSPSPN